MEKSHFRWTIFRGAGQLNSESRVARFFCGKAAVKHNDVSVGQIPDTCISMPINASPFELIVIGRILGETAVTEQGLQSRLDKATEEMRHSISRAASNLANFGVTQSDVELLVEKAIKDAEPGIIRGLRG